MTNSSSPSHHDRSPGFEPSDIVGVSEAIQRVRRQIANAAAYDEPVLVVGPTGTGKGLVARAIHFLGRRRTCPLVTVNCGAIPEDLLAAELFGHEAGAFTGATRARKGLIRSAAGSAVFLDEISESSDRFQVSLLRVLEEGELQPIGSDASVPVPDVRFIAAASRGVGDVLGRGAMRPELFFRLSSFVVEIPPLCERREDIVPLAAHFLEHFSARWEERKQLADAALGALLDYEYPGNVRELRQVVFRAYVRSSARVISAADVRAAFLGRQAPPAAADAVSPRDGEYALQPLIRRHLEKTIVAAGCNLSEAARLLDIPRTTLRHKVGQYQIDVAALQGRLRDWSNGQAA